MPWVNTVNIHHKTSARKNSFIKNIICYFPIKWQPDAPLWSTHAQGHILLFFVFLRVQTAFLDFKLTEQLSCLVKGYKFFFFLKLKALNYNSPLFFESTSLHHASETTEDLFISAPWGSSLSNVFKLITVLRFPCIKTENNKNICELGSVYFSILCCYGWNFFSYHSSLLLGRGPSMS